MIFQMSQYFVFHICDCQRTTLDRSLGFDGFDLQASGLRSCFKITQVSTRQGKNRRESAVYME
jgi:hypothetical protein